MKEGEESIPVATAIARWADRAFKAETEIDRLRAGLQWYAGTFCEGWCRESHSTAVFDDCSGCKARAILAKKEGE